MSKRRRQTAPAGQQRTKTGPEQGPAALQAPAAPENAGGRGIKSRALWLAAIILIVLGYAALKKADPLGKNAWAVAAPALLLSGYLLFIPAILSTFRRQA